MKPSLHHYYLPICAGFALSHAAMAAQPMEEVVVTATKRPESLQEVSVAVTVMDGDRLDDQGIRTLEELTYFVPNIQISEAAVSTNIFIRGMGSGVNQGFEQSVGTFIDGVYYGRARSARNPFLDVERVEVLKGPQGVLFGKNTIAGALNITTRMPTLAWENSLAIDWEPEFDTRELTFITSGPVSDTLGIRLVGRASETDGYLENSLTGDDEPARDEWVVRGTLRWMPTDDLTVTLKGEASEYKVDGRADQLTASVPSFLALTHDVDPAAEAGFDFDKSGPGLEPFFTREFDDTETDNVTLTVDYALGEHTLTSITSRIAYSFDKDDDVDFTNLSFLAFPGQQDYDALSQELWLTSPMSDRFEYILGLFYSKEELDADKSVQVNLAAVPAMDASLPPVIPRTGSRNQAFSQETQSWAAFAQGTWYAREDLRLKFGLRYTRDEKEADKELFFGRIGERSLDNLANATYPLLGFGQPHLFTDLEREEDEVTPSITLEWDIAAGHMLYATFSQGFKAGGFDEDNVNGLTEAEEFDSETVDSYALGLKSTLAGGSAFVNVELFRSEFEDLQVSTFDGSAAFLVGNAAKAVSQGLEVDFRWQATDRLAIGGALGLLDAEYDQYREGPCVFGAGATCDLTGENLQFSPDYSGNLFVSYYQPVSDNWEVAISVDVNVSDDYDIPGDLDPVVAQDSYEKWNARVALASVDGRYSFAIVGKNLTDEMTSAWGNDVPLGNLVGNNYFQFIDPPRSVALQAEVSF